MRNEPLLISFGGVVIGFYGCPPSVWEEPLLLFAQPDAAPDVRIHVKETDVLPKPTDALLLYTAAGFRMLGSGTKRWAFRTDPYRADAPAFAALCYDTGLPDELMLFVDPRGMELNVQSLLSSIMLETHLLRHGRCILHASYILQQQCGILFSAPSGAGKSTQAELWRRHRGAQVINGDKAIFYMEKDGVKVSGLPLCGSSGICRNAAAPLQAIVVLSQGRENRISRMGGKAAVKALLSQMYVRRGESESVAQAMSLASEAAARVPVFQLSCLPDLSAVECLEKAIKGEVHDAEGTDSIKLSGQ